MPLLVPEQMSEAWWEAHIDRITGGTAAGCLGLVKDFAPVSAWRKIIGQGKRESNWYTEYGQRFEDNARAAYERETGNLVFTTGFWVHPTIAWLGASPDGFADEGCIEAKCPQVLAADVPIKHMVQCMVVMAVTQRPWCDYFCWTPNGTFLHRIHRDLVAEAMMLSELGKFYRDYIVTKTQPPRRKSKRKSSDVLPEVTV